MMVDDRQRRRNRSGRSRFGALEGGEHLGGRCRGRELQVSQRKAGLHALFVAIGKRANARKPFGSLALGDVETCEVERRREIVRIERQSLVERRACARHVALAKHDSTAQVVYERILRCLALEPLLGLERLVEFATAKVSGNEREVGLNGVVIHRRSALEVGKSTGGITARHPYCA